MAKYRTRSIEVDAARWFKPGDHPGVLTVATYSCVETDRDPITVLPGDWIVTDPEGRIAAHSPEVFAATYEPVPEPKPMSLRFGPRLDFTAPIPTPPADPPPTDAPVVKVPVEVEAFVTDAIAQPDGTHILKAGVKVPTYSADTSKVLKAVFAVAVPDGQPIPEAEQAFLDSPYPKGGLDLAPPDGNEAVIPIDIAGVPAGKLIVQFILMDED